VICALQIETLDALRSAREIAALDGVDILFVGPADLANSLGIVGGADHPDLLESAAQVSSAAAEFGKTAGVLVATAELAETYVQIGFRFVGCSSDAGLLANEAKRVAEKLRSLPLPTK
jgi:4-hydroxy-2-oxoheptanedioate aldolase